MIHQVDQAPLALSHYHRGDIVVIVAGSPQRDRITNLIHVHRIGDQDFIPPSR